MNRYIDAEWLKGEIRKAFPSFYMRVEINTLVNLAPNIEITRCGECRYWHSGECWGIPYRGDYDTSIDTKDDDFCSYGQKERASDDARQSDRSL